MDELYEIGIARGIRPPRGRSATSLVTPLPVAARELAAYLAPRIHGEVRFDAGSRALYATDGSNYRQVPIGVVVPRDVDDVIETIAACRRFAAPLLPRGGGTSLAGQCCNVAVVLETSKYLRGVLELDPRRKRARVLPGTVLDDLRHAAWAHDLTFAPDPSTHNRCTLGGMLGNDSCGPHSVMAGRTADCVDSLTIVSYDGVRMRVGPTSDAELRAILDGGGRRAEIYRDLVALRDRYADLIRARYPKIPRRVSGYNLDALLPEKGFNVAAALVGSEGTCATILEAELRLVDWPRSRSLLVLGYPDVYQAGDHVPEVMRFGPIALEGLDDMLVDDIHKKGLHEKYVKYLPEGRGFLMVEFGGATREESDAAARRAMDALARGPRPPSMKLYDDPDQEHKLWLVRESGLGATARVPGEPDTWEGWEDSAVPPERLGDYLRALRALFSKHGYHPALYGHFGQGCVHCRVSFDFSTESGLANYRSFMEEATSLVVSMGGSLSGEHGDGQSRAEFLGKMYGEELLGTFREFKRIWDPAWRMNPGKVVEPYRVDENLRLGPDYAPRAVRTHFQYPDDDGDFARATQRCVGVGECRREDGGTMCPSYMVTHEEMHSTRGRTHLLFEMMRGDSPLHGWRDDHVRESLDLCLSCKGCKGECPINVDVATYKAEFLAHYYRGRLRPRAAYSMGLIHVWARLASLAPGLANFVFQTPFLADLAKRIGGIAPAREVPAFAARTFRQLADTRPTKNPDGKPVLFWPDTFNDHFFPETALAAVEVLEAAGYRVLLPPRGLCCGRALYDFGMLPTAKRLLRRTLRALAEPLAQGIPIVGLEPSCVAVFKDELPNLFPDDERAQELSQHARLFPQFLVENGIEVPRLERRAVVHGHCHHKALFGMADESALLERLGVDADVLDSGCCGMAGSFGFERGDKYDVSIRAGERKLLPAVRAADDETLVVADGFSCREQIAQTTRRRALHVAEVVRMAMLQGPRGPSESPPERGWIPEASERAKLDKKKAFVAVGAVAAALVLWRVRSRSRSGIRSRFRFRFRSRRG